LKNIFVIFLVEQRYYLPLINKETLVAKIVKNNGN